MASAGVVEPVDVLEDGSLGLAPRQPALPPDQFGFQRFEELNRPGIVGGPNS